MSLTPRSEHRRATIRWRRSAREVPREQTLFGDLTIFEEDKGCLEVRVARSTPGRTRRGFCGRCGSTLTCESAGLPTETHFYVGAFDRAAELQPKRHVFPQEHLPWFPIAD
jgi:hypothetical protein